MRGKKIGQKPVEVKPVKKKRPGVTGIRKEQDIQKHKITDYLLELLHYEPGMKLPTITYRKIEEYRETCGFDVLYETIRQQEEAINWALNNKEFINETGKICYIFAIVQNNIGGVLLEKKKLEKEKKQTEKMDLIPPDVNINNDFVRKGRDLSAYVEDE